MCVSFMHNVLSSEGFVDLEAVDVIHSEAGFLQETLNRRDGPPSHRCRLNTCGKERRRRGEGEDEEKEKRRRREGEGEDEERRRREGEEKEKKRRRRGDGALFSVTVSVSDNCSVNISIVDTPPLTL